MEHDDELLARVAAHAKALSELADFARDFSHGADERLKAIESALASFVGLQKTLV